MFVDRSTKFLQLLRDPITVDATNATELRVKNRGCLHLREAVRTPQRVLRLRDRPGRLDHFQDAAPIGLSLRDRGNHVLTLTRFPQPIFGCRPIRHARTLRRYFSGDEDAERVAVGIRIDPQRLLVVIGPVKPQGSTETENQLMRAVQCLR